MSEALIFASTNPQYDDRFIIELQVQYMKTPSSEHGENIILNLKINFCTEHVLLEFLRIELVIQCRLIVGWFIQK